MVTFFLMKYKVESLSADSQCSRGKLMTVVSKTLLFVFGAMTNTVEQMVLDTLFGGVTSNMVAEEQADYPQMKNQQIICAHLRNLRTTD